MGIRWTRRRLGYLVWGVGFLFVIVPELLAAIPLSESQLPFPTISRTVGHLEAMHAAWAILPTALIVLFAYELLRVPLRVPPATEQSATDDEVPEVRRFFRNAALCVGTIVAVTVAAFLHWPNQYVPYKGDDHHKLPNFEVAYCLYGVTFLLWLALPTFTELTDRRHRYPSLVRTIVNFEQWLGAGNRVRRALAWLAGFVLVWGMVFLLLHLTLYPFPNIARELNHTELVCNGKVATRWHPGCVVHG